MFIWRFIKLIGCLCVGIIHSQDGIPVLADIEPRLDGDVHVDLSVHDNPSEVINDTNNLAESESIATQIISTTTQTPEQFSCHECTNCISKSDFVSRVCEPGITMCYKMHKRINNNTRITRRGCSTSKVQCTVPHDDSTNTFDSITCCTSHKCNQATQFKPLFFLLIISLFTIIITIINI